MQSTADRHHLEEFAHFRLGQQAMRFAAARRRVFRTKAFDQSAIEQEVRL